MTPLNGTGSYPFSYHSPEASDMEISEDLLTQPLEEDTSELSPRPVIEEEGEGYLLPEMRYPPISLQHDTVIFNEDMSMRSVHGTGLFMEQDRILTKHVMRYIDCSPFPETSKVVAITRAGKHIVWQQAVRSCVPAAISMIALDRGKLFLAREISYPLTSDTARIRYIQKAGFVPIKHDLLGEVVQKARTLECLMRSGPGLLHLNHPSLMSHMVVLDEISLKQERITIRDPYHGYMITVGLFPFLNWVGASFIELADPQ